MNVYLVITGGGTQAISMLTKFGGASSYFVGAEVPYAQKELQSKIPAYDLTLEKSVSKEACQAMLDYANSKLYNYDDSIAIVSTAKLIKLDEREGRENCAYVGIDCNDYRKIFKITFLRNYPINRIKNYKTRERQENKLALFIRDLVQVARFPHFNDLEEFLYESNLDGDMKIELC